MSIATKVEGGFRVCATGAMTCSGMNPCFGCWVEVAERVLPSCIRKMGFSDDEVRRRIPEVMKEYQAAYMRMSDSASSEHLDAFEDMKSAVIDAGPERRMEPEVRQQPYWVVLMTTQLLASLRIARQAASFVATAVTAPAAHEPAPSPPPRGRGTPRRGEVTEYVRSQAEKAAVVSGVVEDVAEKQGDKTTRAPKKQFAKDEEVPAVVVDVPKKEQNGTSPTPPSSAPAKKTGSPIEPS